MEEKDVQKKWVGGICINDGKVLLIHRINKKSDFNKEYFVFPGKIVAGDETLEQALVESFKNISLTVKLDTLLYSKEDDEPEYYYICQYSIGEPSFISTCDEAKEMEGGDQIYTPVWAKLDELEDLIVYPESVKVALLDALE